MFAMLDEDFDGSMEEQLNALSYMGSHWDACVEAITHSKDFNPADPNETVAILTGLINGWRI